MARQLEGKTAFVTGAGRGIGNGIADVLAARGAAIALSDLDEESAGAAAATIEARGGRAISLGGDVTDAESIAGAVAAAIKALGHLDICVANAGVIGAPDYVSRASYVEQDWDFTHRVNVKGLVHTADAVAPHMKERRYGKIINISSHGGRKPRGTKTLGDVLIPYSVSKAAAIQWTHHLAIVLGSFNINVNVVCPGTLWTPMWQAIAINVKQHNPELADLTPREIFDRSIRERMPLGREQTPEDIGRAVAFLASEDASEITGQALSVNGGATMD